MLTWDFNHSGARANGTPCTEFANNPARIAMCPSEGSHVFAEVWEGEVYSGRRPDGLPYSCPAEIRRLHYLEFTVISYEPLVVQTDMYLVLENAVHINPSGMGYEGLHTQVSHPTPWWQDRWDCQAEYGTS